MSEDLMVPRELLERLSTMELDTTPRSIRLQDELRALLSEQPQSSAAQSAPVDNDHAAEYRAALALIEKHVEIWTPKEEA